MDNCGLNTRQMVLQEDRMQSGTVQKYGVFAIYSVDTGINDVPLDQKFFDDLEMSRGIRVLTLVHKWVWCD